MCEAAPAIIDLLDRMGVPFNRTPEGLLDFRRFGGTLYHRTAFAKVQHELANPWMLAVYIVAMIAICWHFSYGVWLFAAKWGITPGTVARKRFGAVCAALGIVLLGMGLASIWAFVSQPLATSF